jgi:hypothetical protein
MAAPNVPFPRALYPPSSPSKSEGGIDVLGVKRAISRAGFWGWQEFDQYYHEQFSKAVANFRKAHGQAASQVYNQTAHDALRNTKAVKPHAGEWAFDALAIQYMQQAYDKLTKPQEQRVAEAMYDYCKLFDGPYVWGGEHDMSLKDDSPHAGYDCSSSTSTVLGKYGLLGSGYAHVSGWFMWWGSPNRGRYITVHAASDHVWIEFTIPGRPWARFDTSPHGCGVRGPRLRTCLRDTDRFVSRHPAGY